MDIYTPSRRTPVISALHANARRAAPRAPTGHGRASQGPKEADPEADLTGVPVSGVQRPWDTPQEEGPRRTQGAGLPAPN